MVRTGGLLEIGLRRYRISSNRFYLNDSP